MKSLILSLLFLSQLASAEEAIEGYLVYSVSKPLCPISADALPNIRDADLDSLPPEQRETFTKLTAFYRFLYTNLPGYCLIQLRLADNNTTEVFVTEAVYTDFFADDLTIEKLRQQDQSHLISLQGEQLVDGDNTAVKGNNVSFKLVDRPPEIIR